MQPSGQSLRNRRSRSGCLSCRRRKVRCDERKPKCQACDRRKLACLFPSPGEAPATNTARYSVRFTTPKGLSTSSPQLAELSPQSDSHQPDVPCSETPREIHNSSDRAHDVPLSPPGSKHTFTGQPSMLEPLSDSTFWELMDFNLNSEFEYPELTSLDSISVSNLTNRDVESTAHFSHLTSGPQSAEQDDSSSAFVAISQEDQEPLHHYLSTMCKFSKMRRSSQDDVYSTIFSTLALRHYQLFQAMMAWSSLHLEQVRQKPTDHARRYALANGILKDQRQFDRLEVTLTIIWFMLQYELLLADGVDKFCSLLGLAADLLQRLFDEHTKEEAMTRLGPVGVRGVVWMSAMDARAAMFEGGGRLLSCLEACPYVSDLFDQYTTACRTGPAVQNLAPRSNSLDEEYSITLRLAVRLRLVLGRTKRLKYWAEGVEKRRQFVEVDSTLRELRADLDDYLMSCPSVLKVAHGDARAVFELSSTHYNQMMLLASFYGAVIFYHEYKPPSATLRDDFMPSRECALRVIRLANHANHSRPESPESVWPQHIFVAGMACAEPIYQDAAVRVLRDAEVWGKNLQKASILLKTMIERQNRTGVTPDIIETMEQTTGLFII